MGEWPISELDNLAQPDVRRVDVLNRIAFIAVGAAVRTSILHR